ncbi:MAG: NAD(P)-dependent glycerol-3-phosphate dehydrogenase [Deltaproteobacteria bacterium]|jgi:glycerol-3-phosphate dehydrogenase (NAD(P)+)|nr:NAD(P)-dependent glycerol-3-phosphate dehydrogenase [Deltaproteobacteria bacterium]
MPVVIGGGSWGTALAHLLACATERPVSLLTRDADVAASVNERRENPRYLPGTRLHGGVRATLDDVALRRAELVVLAVPCQSLRDALGQYAPFLAENAVTVNAAKGIELETLLTPRDIVAQAAPRLALRYATLSGPSFAREVVQNKPTAVVLGCTDHELGIRLRGLFATSWFRTYSSPDVLGVELGGGIKNVMAIAAGLADGLDFGHNARAALISRGLAEMSRLGAVLGAQAATLSGLSGLGDLVLTCTGDLSRNRQTGLRLGRGEKLHDIIASLESVAEGVKTTASLYALAGRAGVDMPIVNAVYSVLYEHLPVKDAVRGLFERELKAE